MWLTTVGGLETETLCKKEFKNKKKTDIFSTVDDGWGHGYYLGGSTMPHKKLFQPLRHANFLSHVFTKCIIEKTAEL